MSLPMNPELSLPQAADDLPSMPGSDLVYRANQVLIDQLVATGQRMTHAQVAYLETSRSALQEMAAALTHALPKSAITRISLFTRRDLEEFATGLISQCFGPEYQVFEGRRYPRIPNGDLLLMDRVVAIDGKRHALAKGSTILTEFDVPPNAWFFDAAYPALPPYAVLMEMALQPCGLLSAYLGSSFPLKDVDLYFRNLDGHAKLLAAPDLRGKTVSARAELLSSTLSGVTIIQGYRFSLACDGQPFFAGESVFGFFSAAGMANQVGLDGGSAPNAPSLQSMANLPGAHLISLDRATSGPLGLLDEALLIPGSGKQGLGQVVARQKIDARDWFYRCHFHQDPVMPGSLGVEAVLQAVALFAGRTSSLSNFAVVSYPAQQAPFIWKYRGQILPTQREMVLSADITSRTPTASGEVLTANASVWIDGVRIYELTNLAITLQPNL